MCDVTSVLERSIRSVHMFLISKRFRMPGAITYVV
jgi:hypothetical protein